MCVDLLGLVLVQAHETVEDVVASSSIVWTSLVVWEVVLHWADWQLLLKAIDLVEEENDARFDKPSGVADTVKESQGFLHTVYGLILEKKLVIFGDGDKEEDGGNVFETMNPLLALGSLSTNIEHSVGEVANDKCGLSDTCSLYSRSKDILVVRNVVGLSNAIYRVKVARGGSVSICTRL